MNRAIVLLSGGMDSAVTLAYMQRSGFDCIALSFDYGQRHRVELEAADRVATSRGVRERVVQHIDLRAFGGSALTQEIAVPKDRDLGGTTEINGVGPSEIPITYVPARNTIFLALALACAEVRSARDIAIGVNAVDYSGYPDCRPEFIEAFARLANLATRAGVESAQGEAVGSDPARGRDSRRGAICIHAPLQRLTKVGIVRLGLELKVDFALTSSCYDPLAGGRPCQHCDACVLRARGFAGAGAADPLLG
ncbi:MAG: 7-cyano-7-deazaguanine synthase [Phycisphaerales bacterium]|nr:7-cyano-7-deazaguanine synthase [Phycisphaerales bacterium]